MLPKIKVLFLLGCANVCAAQNALTEDFFSTLEKSLTTLSTYQAKISEKIIELCFLYNQAKFTFDNIDQLDDPEDQKTLIQQELKKDVKLLRMRCSELILQFQKAHGQVIFKHELLFKEEQRYTKALDNSMKKPMPEALVALSQTIKSLLRQLAQVVGDKDSWVSLNKRTGQQNQYQFELKTCCDEIKTLCNCLCTCKKSPYINKKLAELEARKRALEMVIVKFENDSKAFLNRYGAQCIESCFTIMSQKESMLREQILLLSKQKQEAMDKFIGLEVISFTLEQAQTFYKAKKCIDNYKIILAELSSFVQNAKL